VAEDREVREKELRKFFQKQTKVFTKSRRAISLWTVRSRGHVAEIYAVQENLGGNARDRNSRSPSSRK
jgi:hypothetical protein